MKKFYVGMVLSCCALEFMGMVVAMKGMACYFANDGRAFSFFWGGLLFMASGALGALGGTREITKIDEK